MGKEQEITPEQVKKDWLLLKKYKSLILSLVIGIISGGGSVLGVWELYSKPQMKDMIEANNNDRDSIRKTQSGSFRDELGILLEVPKEMVSVSIYMRFDSLSKFMREAKRYEDFLVRESKLWRVGTFADENGDKFWAGWDWRDHPIVDYENGRPWVIYNHQKYYIDGRP